MQPLRDQIEEMRGNQESLAFWQRRRRFLSVHWNKFPPEELNSLSYCYSSVMVYSCRYPQAMMNRLYDLAMEVVDDLQKEKEGKVIPQEIKTKWDEAISEPLTFERVMLNIEETERSRLLDDEEDSEDFVEEEQSEEEERMRKDRGKGGISDNGMYTETSTSPTLEVAAEEEDAANYPCNMEQPSPKIPKPVQNPLRLQTENLAKIMNFSPKQTSNASVESQWKYNTPLLNKQTNFKNDNQPERKFFSPRDNGSTLKPSTATTPRQNPLQQQQKSSQAGEKQRHALGDALSTASKSNALLTTPVHKASITAGKWKQEYNTTSSKDMRKKTELLQCESPSHPLSNRALEKHSGSSALQDQATGSKKASTWKQTEMTPVKLAGKSECVKKSPTIQVDEAKPGNVDTKAKMVTFQEQTKKNELSGKRVNAAYKSVWKVHSSNPVVRKDQKDDLPRRKRSNDTKTDELQKSYTKKGLHPQMSDETLSGREATKKGRNDTSFKGPQRTLSNVDINPVVRSSRVFSETRENSTRGPQRRGDTASRVIYSSNFTKPPPLLPVRNKMDEKYKGPVSGRQAPGSYPKSYLPQSQESLKNPKATVVTDRGDKPKRAENALKSTHGSTGSRPSNSIFKNFLQGLLQKAKRSN
ncbi:uncharacterized protein LOC134265987 [Saccostrea cucullata]|uniref:uncharacterized protein LOC134265987 n=1 Tax=Saccostrea cuccullata TaxID=36930 RepID=UPI002ED272E9